MTTPDPIETIRAEYTPIDVSFAGQAVHTLLAEVDRLRGELTRVTAQRDTFADESLALEARITTERAELLEWLRAERDKANEKRRQTVGDDEVWHELYGHAAALDHVLHRVYYGTTRAGTEAGG